MLRTRRSRPRIEIHGNQMSSDDDAHWSLLEFAKKVAAIPKNVAKELDHKSLNPISENSKVSEPGEQSLNRNDTPSEISSQPSEELAVDEPVDLQIANNHFGAGHSTYREKQLK